MQDSLLFESLASQAPKQSFTINNSQIFICQFHYEHGPQQIYPQSDKVDVSPQMFPAKWNDRSIFMTKSKNHYIMAICMLMSNITTQRGNLQLTVGIGSTNALFTKQHYQFLNNIYSLIHEAKSIDCELIKSEAEKASAISDSPITLNNPLDFFDGEKIICETFKQNPEILFALWKARMCRLKISIANTQNIFVASYISFFLISTTLSFKPAEECAFHIELSDSDEIDSQNTLVYGVTHPFLAAKENIPVVFAEGNKLKLKKELNWLSKGSGKLLNNIDRALQTNNDVNVINLLYHVSEIMSTWKDKRTIQSNDVENVGLSSSSVAFIRNYLSVENSPAEADFASCC